MLLNSTSLNDLTLDDAEQSFTFAKLKDDPLNPTDAGDIAFYLWNYSDSFVLSDNAFNSLGSTTYTQTKTDAIVLLDALLHSTYRNPTASDTATVSDATLRSVLRNRLADDALIAIDGLISTATRSRLSADNAVLADELLKSAYRNRLVSDALTVLDNSVAGRVLQKLSQDTATLTDAALRNVLYARLLSDAVTLVDQLVYSIIGTVIYFKTKTDTLDVTDAGRTVNWVVMDSDAAGMSDQLVNNVLHNILTRTASDSLRVTDGGRTFNWVATRSDYTVLTDSATATVGQPGVLRLTASDALTLGDSVVKVFALSRVQSDSLRVFDASGVLQKTIISTVSDTPITLVDALTKITNGALQRLVSDALSVTDAGRTINWTITARDYAQMLDTISKTFGPNNALFKTASDAVALVDTIFRVRAMTLVAQDTVQVLDSSGVVQHQIYATATEPLLPFDEALHTVRMRRLLADAIVLLDSITGPVAPPTIVRTASDSLQTSDGLLRFMRITRLASESVALIDQVIWQVFASGNLYSTTLTDRLGVVDEHFHQALRFRGPTDAVAMQDARILQALRNRTPFDTVTISDGVLQLRWFRRTVADLVGISDEALGAYLPYWTIALRTVIEFGSLSSGCVLREEPEPWELGATELQLLTFEELMIELDSQILPIAFGGFN